MKLIRCHIENFGILSQIDWEFKEGLQSICEENGWGKSTFAAFLKVMFYGFGNEKKRSATERERMKYKPWQGGVYGGSIEFQNGKHSYRMERTFGDREKEDTFMLFDLQTGLPTVMYSNEIGKELFRLDEESFLKTIYISSEDCTTAATDSIHAKIGNLTESMYDLENYSVADRLLQQEMNRLTPKRKTGLLAKCEEEIQQIQAEIYEGKRAEAIWETQKLEWEQKLEQRKSVKEEIERLRQKILEAGKLKDKQAMLAVYQELCAQQREKETQVEEVEDYFGNGIPEMEEISQTLELVEQQRMANVALEQGELLASENQLLDQIQSQWTDLPTPEEIEVNLKRLEEEEIPAQEEEQVEEERVEHKTILSPLLFVGMFFCIIGVGYCISAPVEGIVVFVVGIIVGVIGNQNKRVVEVKPQGKIPAKSPKQNVRAQVQEFLEKYPLADTKDQKDHLLRLQVILVQLEGMLDRKEQQENKRLESEVLEQEIAQFYEKYNLPEEESKVLQLQNMLGMLERYHAVAADYYKVARKKEEFERENDIAAIVAEQESAGTLEDLHTQLDHCMAKDEALQKELYEQEKMLEQFQKQKEHASELQQRLEKLQELKEENLRKYRLVENTRTYLQLAKERFVSRYKSPLTSSFEKYVQKLVGVEQQLSLDTNMAIRKQEQGIFRDSQSLSSGWRDLLGICLRFAIADAMFPEEKPFLILDDPFVNLDDEKMKGALELLQSISEEYQVIYFACHNSRRIEQS